MSALKHCSLNFIYLCTAVVKKWGNVLDSKSSATVKYVGVPKLLGRAQVDCMNVEKCCDRKVLGLLALLTLWLQQRPSLAVCVQDHHHHHHHHHLLQRRQVCISGHECGFPEDAPPTATSSIGWSDTYVMLIAMLIMIKCKRCKLWWWLWWCI